MGMGGCDWWKDSFWGKVLGGGGHLSVSFETGQCIEIFRGDARAFSLLKKGKRRVLGRNE